VLVGAELDTYLFSKTLLWWDPYGGFVPVLTILIPFVNAFHLLAVASAHLLGKFFFANLPAFSKRGSLPLAGGHIRILFIRDQANHLLLFSPMLDLPF